MRLFPISILILVSLVACNDEPSAIGSGFFQDGSLDIVYVDSLTVKISTVGFDSLVTSDATRFLVGYHNDPEVGKLQASAVFQLAPASALSLDEDFTSYSRTSIIMVPDGYSYYDTSGQVSLYVHELTQEMETEDGYLYNTSSFSYNQQAIGSLTFLPRPQSSDTLEIPINDAFGNQIFTLAQQEAEDVSGATAFIERFAGIAIVADTSSSGAILGFGVTPEMRVYYWDKTTTPSEEKYLAIRGGAYLKYNKITQDRKETSLSPIQSKRESLSSTLTDNGSFVQAGAGLALRLDIPYLKNVLLDNDELAIADAVLEFYPTRNDGRNTALPEHLTVSAVNYKNDFFESQSLQATLIEDEYLGRDTRYEVNVSSFIKQQLATEELNENALLFSLNDLDFRQSVNRVRIADQKMEKKMKIKLYCVVSKN